MRGSGGGAAAGEERMYSHWFFFAVTCDRGPEMRHGPASQEVNFKALGLSVSHEVFLSRASALALS